MCFSWQNHCENSRRWWGLTLEGGQSIAQDQQVACCKHEAASYVADSFSSGIASVSGRRPWILLINYEHYKHSVAVKRRITGDKNYFV